jgi:hypothetical protein
LPGSGYTFDVTWNCGAIQTDSGEYCYYNGTLSWSAATKHTWGWGSAAYNGTGTTWVCVEAQFDSGADSFGGCGTNLARSCYFANCNDQDSVYLRMNVQNHGANAHTIWGHGEA